MTTRRRPVAVGAIAASVLLLAATACSSSADDSTVESLPAVAVETTVDPTVSTDPATPDTDAPNATTAAPSPSNNDTGTNSDSDTDTDTDTGDDDPSSTEAVVVPEALQFTAPLVGGGTFDGAAVAGKPTVFWFWAPT